MDQLLDVQLALLGWSLELSTDSVRVHIIHICRYFLHMQLLRQPAFGYAGGSHGPPGKFHRLLLYLAFVLPWPIHQDIKVRTAPKAGVDCGDSFMLKKGDFGSVICPLSRYLVSSVCPVFITLLKQASQLLDLSLSRFLSCPN